MGRRLAPDGLVLASLLLAGLVLRLWALSASGELSSDEALPGLMARHIVLGRELPVFYYGQHYFGVLEAYLIAALFAVFGFQPWLVVAPATAASLALIPLTWAIADHMAQRPAGLLAALPVALPPPALARLFTNAGGGFALAFALQSAAVLCCLRADRGDANASRWAALFWLATGLAGWVWQPALVALPPLMLVVLIRHPPLRRLATLARCMAPVAIGLLPPLVYNAGLDWPTLRQLTRYTGENQATNPWGVAQLALGGGDESLTVINPLLAVLVGLAFLATPAFLVLGSAGGIKREPIQNDRRRAVGLDGLGAVLQALIAHQAVRHLVPTVLAGHALTGAMLTLALRRAGYGTWIGVAALMLVIGVGSLTPYAGLGDRFSRAVPSTSEVMAAVSGLDERELRTGYADYWSAYTVTYFSGERIIVAPRLAPPMSGRIDRYPAYTRQVDAVAQPEALFALVERACDLEPYVEPLEQVGAMYRVEELARWWLVWDIQPRANQERETLEAWREGIEARQNC